MTDDLNNHAFFAAITTLFVVTGACPNDFAEGEADAEEALSTGAFFRSFAGAKAYVESDCAAYLDEGLGEGALTWHEHGQFTTAILGDEACPDMVWRITRIEHVND